MTDRLAIRRPDDFHLHLRDGEMMRAVLPFTAAVFARAIVMPNLRPPVRSAQDAAAYRDRIRACLPRGHPFEPLMTAYLTDDADSADLERGFADGTIRAVKLYPAGATTNSESGVTSMERVDRVLAMMERNGMPLLLHGEVTDPAVDVFDREAVYVERVLDPLRRRFPALRIVLEHVTTAVAVDYVRSVAAGLAATITPHHLTIDRNAMFRDGLDPHMYCLPVAKRERHRRALRAAAASGDARFFLGTDSAPHPRRDKEAACGCAGIFNAPTAMAAVAQAFDEEGALDRLEAFASANGARFYGYPENTDRIVLRRTPAAVEPPPPVAAGGDRVVVFSPRAGLRWEIAAGVRPCAPEARTAPA